MADLARIKRNVAKMAGMDAPESDIDGYIASEGVTIDDVRNFREQPAVRIPDAQPTPEAPGVMDWLSQSNLVQSQRKRGADLADIVQDPNKQNAGSRILQTAGNVAGTVGDLAGAATSNVASGIYNALPQERQRVLQEQGAALAGSDLGRGVSKLAQAYEANKQAFAKQHPEAAKNYQAVVDMGNLLPLKLPSVRKGVKVAGKEGRQALLNVSKDLVNVAPEGVARVLTPNIDESLAPLVQSARKFNIPVARNQISPSKFRETAQKVSEQIPLSGEKGFRDLQVKRWNKALAGTLGEYKDLSPSSINNFLDDASTKFNSILKDRPVVISPEDLTNIDTIKIAARKNIETGLADVVERNIDDVLKDLSGGVVNGTKLASVRSELLKTSTRAQGGAKEYIGDIIESLDNIASKNLSKAEVVKLAEARKQWRNFRTIEPLLEKSTTGIINPVDLNNRVAQSRFIKASRTSTGQDDLVDLARVGKEFLRVPGGSDTAQKVALGSGLSAGATSLFYNPAAAAAGAGIAGVTIGANRAYQGINRSQKLMDRAVKKAMKLPPKKAKAAIREILQEQKK